MASITDGFKDIFLAGIGAMAIGAEKSKELVDQLIARGEITIEQGKEINSELKHKTFEATSDLRDDSIAVQMAAMSAAEREQFAARVAELAAEANQRDSQRAAEKAAAATTATKTPAAGPVVAEPSSVAQTPDCEVPGESVA